MAWLILGASEGMIILWLMIEILRAPSGYQDETGFHEGKEDDRGSNSRTRQRPRLQV